MTQDKVAGLPEKFKTFFHKPHRSALLWTGVVLVGLLLVWGQLGRGYQRRLLDEQRAQISAALGPYGNALTKSINRRFAILDGMAAFVQFELDAKGMISHENFNSFTRGLLVSAKGVRGLSIAPDAVQQFVFPLAGNERIIGSNLLDGTRPEVTEAVMRTIDSRHITLSGPYPSQDSDTLVLVARLAVFQKEDFWGLVTMTLDVPAILTDAGLEMEVKGLTIALRDSDGRVFYGQEAVFDAEPVTFSLELPEGHWELAAVPTQGWQQAIQPTYFVSHGSGLIITILLTGVVYLVISRQQRLTAEGEEKYQSLFEQSVDGIYLHDLQGKILDVNRVAVSQSGYSKDVLLSMDIFDVRADQHTRDSVLTQWRQWNPEQPVTIKTTHRRKGGDIFPVEVKTGKVRFGDRELILAIARDITEQVQIEKERERLLAQIRDQARQMEQVLATVPDGVLLLKSDGRVVLTNAVAKRDMAMLANTEAGDILTHLGDRTLAEVLTSPPTQGLWHEVKAAAQTFEVIARPIENGATPEAWVLVLHDATKEREVQQRGQRQGRLAAVGQLAAGIAHDFNNIIAVIVLYAQMGLRIPDVPAKLRERLEIIAQQAKRATELIQQLLDFGRRAVLERRPMDLIPFLKEQVKLLERTLPESIQINFAYERGDYTVNADPTRMQQAMMNLALNARDAMPEGGELCISLSPIHVESHKEAPLPDMGIGTWVRVTVQDSGTGIPPDVLPHIFDPFFTTKAPGEGTGLGLAQVYGIVKQHEGYIDVITEMGQGTTFVLYLPNLPAKPVKACDTETKVAFQGQKETILVVEDNKALREALVGSIESLNYRVIEATNGQEALAILEAQPHNVALIVSDLVMPEMGGQALFYALKQRDVALPMVMLSGHPMENELKSLQAQGLTGWLLKPPSMEELARLLARALKRESQ